MLISLLDNKIIFYEKSKDEVISTSYLFDDIMSIEEGSILLYSWIRISGISENIFKTTLVEFNTVISEIFEYVIKTLRTSINKLDHVKPSKELDKLNFLSNLNFKFMSYGRSSVLGNEQLLDIVYQPSIVSRFLKFFKKIIIEDYLIILANKELILIKNEDAGKYGKGGEYGCITFYYPLGKITDISLKNNEERYACLIPKICTSYLIS